VTLPRQASCNDAGSALQAVIVLIHCGVVQKVATFEQGNSVHAHAAVKSDVVLHTFDPLTHCANLQVGGLHSPSTCT
jgi:hypothetical protein